MTARHTSCALLAVAVFSALAVAADAPFKFDRQLALDLAGAYVRAEQRARPDRALPGIAYGTPDVVARVAMGGRHLVYVTYQSTKPTWGATVVLELCAANSELTVVDVAWTDGLDRYLSEVRSVNEGVSVGLPAACPEGGP